MKPSVFAVLKCGWGVVLGIAGVASILIDLAAPTAALPNGESIPLFRGSFALGWLVAVGVMIVPAAAVRGIGLVPLHKAPAIAWCVLAFMGWSGLRAALSGSPTPVGSLVAIAGLVLCWRLLRTADQDGPTTKSPVS